NLSTGFERKGFPVSARCRRDDDHLKRAFKKFRMTHDYSSSGDRKNVSFCPYQKLIVRVSRLPGLVPGHLAKACTSPLESRSSNRTPRVCRARRQMVVQTVLRVGARVARRTHARHL